MTEREFITAAAKKLDDRMQELLSAYCLEHAPQEDPQSLATKVVQHFAEEYGDFEPDYYAWDSPLEPED